MLAWEVVVVGDDAGATCRPAATTSTPTPATWSTSGRCPRRSLPPAPHLGRTAGRRHAAAPDPNSVTVTGTDPLGRDLTAFGLQNGDRVELTDTTTDAWDDQQRTGAVQTYDASALKNESGLPGTLVTSPSTKITDAEAIAAQAYSHRIVDYYESLGRDSWDDEGGPLISSVHFGPESYCNAMFASYLRQPQMVYGNPCVQQGQQLAGPSSSPTSPRTRSPTASPRPAAGLLYTGQSGALNESFSDYFGNVIGNLIHGNDSVAIGEDACAGAPAEPALRGEPGRHLVVPLHAQRQRLRRLPADPHARASG